MQELAASELILNENKSIYHLNLHPENLATTIITVGDPDRVDKVTKYFDKVEFKIRKREFHTQTGYLDGKRISVISTGIGTDNIDIVVNELDALVNIDLGSRTLNKDHQQLEIIRIGTSGAIQKDIPVDSFVLSELAVGFDKLLHYYQREDPHPEFSSALHEHLDINQPNYLPYLVCCNEVLASKFTSEKITRGITATNVGFYGPQGRVLRLQLKDKNMNDKLASFRLGESRITNLEMETSGIYGLAELLGHKAVSLNAIIANRATGKFSSDPKKATDELIKLALERIIQQ